MKKNLSHLKYCFLMILLVSLSSIAVPAQSRNNSHDFKSSANIANQTPEIVIKAFYKWYINAIEEGPDPFKKGRPILQKYVTLRLIKQIERTELDADGFLQTQEWDKNWANTIAISKLNIKGATASAIVTFDSKLHYPRVLVSLVKEAGNWKIDRVVEKRYSS